MDLVLSLVLEHADVVTLLDCLFLSKHIHKVIMNISRPLFTIMRELESMFNGDIYQGIKFLEGSLDIFHVDETSWDITEEKIYRKYAKHGEYNKTVGLLEYRKMIKRQNPNIAENLLEIYKRLYPFNINANALYIKETYADEVDILVRDFTSFIDKYYYKMNMEMIFTLLIYGESDVMKLIISYGFDIDQIIKTGWGHTTLLVFYIDRDNMDMVDFILDRKPNVFICDSNNKAPCTFFNLPRNRKKYAKYPHIVDKFGALVKEQTNQLVRWNFQNIPDI